MMFIVNLVVFLFVISGITFFMVKAAVKVFDGKKQRTWIDMLTQFGFIMTIIAIFMAMYFFIENVLLTLV